MDKLVQSIIAIVLILVAARVILFLVGVTLNIIANILVLVVCIGGIVFAINYFNERK